MNRRSIDLTKPWALVVFLATASFITPHMAMANEAGRKAFEDNCALCHDVTSSKINGAGPSLYGIVGSKAASSSGFGYSQALKAKGAQGWVWTQALIAQFAADPQNTIPGTNMLAA